MSEHSEPLVNILMGSKSDWGTMQHTRDMLEEFGIANECRVLSAHRTPAETTAYVGGAEERGVEVIIAAAGGAAHLAGVCAAHTVLPVLGVPVQSRSLSGLDSLLSIVQMPKGYPVATMAIGAAGAANAALMAAGILALQDAELAKRLDDWRDALSASIPEVPHD